MPSKYFIVSLSVNESKLINVCEYCFAKRANFIISDFLGFILFL